MSSKRKDIRAIASEEMRMAMKNVNKAEQIQSLIDAALYFWKNTINLLVARRASGKTWHINLERVKLSLLPDCGGYSPFVIICLKFIKLKVIHYTYENAVPMKT
jgi:hypothetical protein